MIDPFKLALVLLSPSIFLSLTQVIWKKNSDYLSIGKNSIKDQRMSVKSPYTRDWNLHISNIREDDAGDYFCTVTTHHEQSKRVHLNIHSKCCACIPSPTMNGCYLTLPSSYLASPVLWVYQPCLVEPKPYCGIFSIR